MKKWLFWLFKAFLAGIAALIIISLISLFYSFTGLHRPNPSGATDYIWGPNQLMVEMQEGFTVLRYDANGFNNWKADYTRPVDNLLMGDSQAQAAYVMGPDSLTAVLNRLCPEQYTYSIATNAHFLCTCVKNLENAVQVYAPSNAVIIDTMSVEMDIDSMRQVIDGEYPTLPSYNTGLVAKLQLWLPGVKLLYKQLDSWASQMADEQETVAGPMLTKEYEDTLTAFLKKAADATEPRGIKLIIFYIPSLGISEAGNIVYQTDPNMLAAFTQACSQNGILFLDMTQAFDAMYKQENKLPYGFINTQAGKGHLNKYGYQVIASELAEVLHDL